MNKQKILDMINNEQVQTMIREGKTSSLIFSIKNHIGDLARVLEIFQEHGINVVHIESRISPQSDSKYEIYVDLEADQTRLEQSKKALQRQLSCVEFEPSILLQSSTDYSSEAVETANNNLFVPSSSIDQNRQESR